MYLKVDCYHYYDSGRNNIKFNYPIDQRMIPTIVDLSTTHNCLIIDTYKNNIMKSDKVDGWPFLSISLSLM